MLCHRGDRYITPSLLARGTWEPAESAYLAWRLRPGMTFVDAGANIGWFSLLASRAVGDTGRVLAFEPEPSCFRLLEMNLARNGCGNVAAFPLALGERPGWVDLHVDGWNLGDHRTYPSEPGRPTRRVRQIALDELPGLDAPLDVVKIDVQGAEEGVIRGMQRLLAASPAVVVTAEYWPYGLTRYGSEPGPLLDYYRSLGFTIEVHFPDRPFPVPLDRAELERRCPVSDETAQATLVLTRPGAPAG